jgi:hypothetical protein
MANINNQTTLCDSNGILIEIIDRCRAAYVKEYGWDSQEGRPGCGICSSKAIIWFLARIRWLSMNKKKKQQKQKEKEQQQQQQQKKKKQQPPRRSTRLAVFAADNPASNWVEEGRCTVSFKRREIVFLDFSGTD